MIARFTKVLELLSAYREAEVALESLSALVMESCSNGKPSYTDRPYDKGHWRAESLRQRTHASDVCCNRLKEIHGRPRILIVKSLR